MTKPTTDMPCCLPQVAVWAYYYRLAGRAKLPILVERAHQVLRTDQHGANLQYTWHLMLAIGHLVAGFQCSRIDFYNCFTVLLGL